MQTDNNKFNDSVKRYACPVLSVTVGGFLTYYCIANLLTWSVVFNVCGWIAFWERFRGLSLLIPGILFILGRKSCAKIVREDYLQLNKTKRASETSCEKSVLLYVQRYFGLDSSGFAIRSHIVLHIKSRLTTGGRNVRNVALIVRYSFWYCSSTLVCLFCGRFCVYTICSPGHQERQDAERFTGQIRVRC